MDISAYSWRLECYKLLKKPEFCEHCKHPKELTLHFSHTAYCDNRINPLEDSRWSRLEVDLPPPSSEFAEIERKLDPNSPSWLCKECTEEDIEYWEGMWNDFYSSVL